MKNAMLLVMPFALHCLLSNSIYADTNLTSSVCDGSGEASSGGAYELISAAAQPGGVSQCSGGVRTSQAGFLGTFSLRPGLDSDGDGLPDETDPDNDDDTLDDEAEITGTAYGAPTTTDPNDPDSDNDGMGDGEEAASGSDPNDTTMYLHITEIGVDAASGNVMIEWQAQGGNAYGVYCLGSLFEPRPGTHLGDVAADGGEGPWNVTLTNFLDTTCALTTGRFYYVVHRP